MNNIYTYIYANYNLMIWTYFPKWENKVSHFTVHEIIKVEMCTDVLINYGKHARHILLMILII